MGEIFKLCDADWMEPLVPGYTSGIASLFLTKNSPNCKSI